MIRSILIKDLGWKVFSLLLAVFIWLTVHRILTESGGATSHSFGNGVTYDKLPVYIVSKASDVHFFRVAPAAVSVTVNGSPEVMAVLQANQIHAIVDLTDIGSGQDLRRRVEISAPPGVALVRVEPADVGVIIPPRPLH